MKKEARWILETGPLASVVPDLYLNHPVAPCPSFSPSHLTLSLPTFTLGDSFSPLVSSVASVVSDFVRLREL